MIVLSRSAGKSELAIHALKNNFEADAYFVKVIGEWGRPRASERRYAVALWVSAGLLSGETDGNPAAQTQRGLFATWWRTV